MCANIIVTEWYPLDKLAELLKLNQKIALKPPKVLKRVGNSPYGTTTECGCKNVAIYEVEDAKLADGIKEAVSRRSGYIGVAGYRFQVEVAYPIAEAMALMQLTPK